MLRSGTQAPSVRSQRCSSDGISFMSPEGALSAPTGGGRWIQKDGRNDAAFGAIVNIQRRADNKPGVGGVVSSPEKGQYVIYLSVL